MACTNYILTFGCFLNVHLCSVSSVKCCLYSKYYFTCSSFIFCHTFNSLVCSDKGSSSANIPLSGPYLPVLQWPGLQRAAMLVWGWGCLCGCLNVWLDLSRHVRLVLKFTIYAIYWSLIWVILCHWAWLQFVVVYVYSCKLREEFVTKC